MPTIKNAAVEVQLDDHWPRTLRLTRLDGGGSVSGADPGRAFTLELNDVVHGEDALSCSCHAGGEAVDYEIIVPGLDLKLGFRFALEDNVLVFTMPVVEENGAFRLQHLYFPRHDLVTGTGENRDSYLRHVTRRANWSRHWCPGTGTYDQWEDLGEVGGALPERGAQYTNHACVWNTGLCAAVLSSTYVQPLMTGLDGQGSVKSGRAGRFSIWAGTYSYRLREKTARPFEVRIALLGDYDGNGSIDWCDAANWEGDCYLPEPDPMYKEAVVYKIEAAQEGKPFANCTFEDCLDIIRMVHRVTDGMRQVCYVNGALYDGHDTGYPSLAKVNPKVGTPQGFAGLIRDAREYNCIVSMHINYDSCYTIHPEWREDCVSRDGEGRPHVWYTKHYQGDRKVHSMNHTKDVETGFAQDRLNRLTDMIPLEKTIHLDAFRPYSEAWEPDGSHIDAECEVQRGIIPIVEMFRAKGLDITTEDTDDEKRGLFRWVWIMADWQHGYKTVMTHGRLFGRGRSGLRGGSDVAAEGVALGLGQLTESDPAEQRLYEANVKGLYLYWMHYQMLSRKRMTGYRIGDWGFGMRAWYEDDTCVHAEPYPTRIIEVDYEGIPIVRGTDRFLPWRPDEIFAFSLKGGPQEWTLPASWKGATIQAALLRPGGRVPGPTFEVEGHAIRFTAPAAIPIRFVKQV